MYTLTLAYTLTDDTDLWNTDEVILKALGREGQDGSGAGFGQRDMEFVYETRPDPDLLVTILNTCREHNIALITCECGAWGDADRPYDGDVVFAYHRRD